MSFVFPFSPLSIQSSIMKSLTIMRFPEICFIFPNKLFFILVLRRLISSNPYSSHIFMCSLCALKQVCQHFEALDFHIFYF
uniref:Ovule protein n=1 Tax=Brugia timori TaxID=42155 RepID=A0A0R3QV92_9BILA